MLRFVLGIELFTLAQYACCWRPTVNWQSRWCWRIDATVHTDGSAAYRTLTDPGYLHQRTVMLGSDVAAHVSMPGVHRVAALLKRWILGTHHGATLPAHMDAYLGEFVFRFNRRSSSSRGMLF